MNRSTLIRVVLVGALMAGWVALRWAKPEWAQMLMTPWVSLWNDYGWWVPAVGGGLLVISMVYSLSSVWGPYHSRKADDAMALGCLMFAGIGIGVVVLVLGLAVIFQIHFLVNLISFTTMVLAAFIIPQLIWALLQDRRKKG